MGKVFYLKPNKNEEMEYLKKEERPIYDFLISSGCELKNIDGQLFVIGEGFELTIELFVAIAKKQLAENET